MAVANPFKFKKRERKKPKNVQVVESDETLDARRERAETAWARAALAPAGQKIIDNKIPLAKTALAAPVQTQSDLQLEAPSLDQHDVAPGETWNTVAAQYGVSVLQLQAANPTMSARPLAPGVRLSLPTL